MITARCFVPVVLLATAIPGTAQITVGTIPTGILCANVQMELPYTAVGTYNAGNTFTAELSDVNGSFATPTVLGTVVSTASGTITCTFPAGLFGNGFQLRVNSSDPPEIGVPTAGLLMEAPDAGTSATATICGSTVNALPLLGGTPEPGGNWSVVAGSMTWVVGDLFAGITNGSVVEYHVTSPNGCPAVSQLQFLTVVPPNAGTNGSVTLCSNSALVSLISYLGGTPDLSGSWSGPSPVVGGNYDPATMEPGVYTYTTNSSAPCPNASASVIVTEHIAANAGTSATLSVCSSDAPFSMLSMLSGTPDLGGMWEGPAGMVQPALFTPGVSLQGCYTYTVAGTLPCANASSTLCISVSIAPVLGPDLSITLCTPTPLDMGAGLPPGGTWTYLGAAHSNMFTPGVDTPGPYVYTIPGTAPCPDVSLTALMNVDVPPDAGSNAGINWCLSYGNVDLFSQLGGTPMAGGTWTDVNGTGQLTGGTLMVAGLPGGTYAFTYTVDGGACDDDQATVTVNLSPACIVSPQAPYPVE